MKRLALLVALFAAILVSPGSAEAQFIPGLNKVANDKGEVFRKGCMVGHDRLRSGRCVFGDRRSRKTVVLFGDSHAMQWGPALIRLAKRKHWKVIALTRASCPPAAVKIDFNCDTWRRNSIKRIRKTRPGLLILSTQANFQGYGVVASGVPLGRDSSEPYLVDGMINVLSRLRRWAGKTVVIRDQAVTPFNVTLCLRYSPPGKCGFRPDRPRRYAYDYKAARRVKGVRIVDPQRMLCPGGWCRPVDHRILVYRNQGHLSASFTSSKWGWLGVKLGDPFRGRD